MKSKMYFPVSEVLITFITKLSKKGRSWFSFGNTQQRSIYLL